MKKFVLILSIFLGYSLLLQAQKIKVISVFKLIDSEKFDEAKKSIEEVITEEKNLNWYRTWYARGLLCQTAYQKGMKDKDKKKYELYPDQLYVAYDAYEKALSLDTKGRLETQLPPLYVLLANDFQKLGEKHYNSKEYAEALKAFKQALKIMGSPILSVNIDTSLLYNTALAAYESKQWNEAAEYLSTLHDAHYSANATLLLFEIYIGKGDTTSAERTLSEGVDVYKANEDLVLLLADLLFQGGKTEKAIAILDSVSLKNPSKYIFPYSKGLIYQKEEQYLNAIEAYKTANELAPKEFKILVNIGNCYYNIGVEIDEHARTIINSSIFRQEKEKSANAFESSIQWFEKAYEINPGDQAVVMKLHQLYKVLHKVEKIKSLESLD